jgi:hypothetical protein
MRDPFMRLRSDASWTVSIAPTLTLHDPLLDGNEVATPDDTSYIEVKTYCWGQYMLFSSGRMVIIMPGWVGWSFGCNQSSRFEWSTSSHWNDIDHTMQEWSKEFSTRPHRILPRTTTMLEVHYIRLFDASARVPLCIVYKVRVHALQKASNLTLNPKSPACRLPTTASAS